MVGRLWGEERDWQLEVLFPSAAVVLGALLVRAHLICVELLSQSLLVVSLSEKQVKSFLENSSPFAGVDEARATPVLRALFR